MTDRQTDFDQVFDQDHAKDFARLRKELEAFIHVVEMLALCRQQLGSPIDPKTVRQLAHVFKEHLAQSIIRIYDI